MMDYSFETSITTSLVILIDFKSYTVSIQLSAHFDLKEEMRT